MLIGLTGRGLNEHGEFVSTARVGKDFAGNILREDFNALQISFALAIKRISQVMFGLSHEEAWSDDRIFKETPMQDYGFSPRRVQQIVGTEVGRNELDSNLWINLVEQTCQQIDNQTFERSPLWMEKVQTIPAESFEDLTMRVTAILFNIPLSDVKQSHIHGQSLPIGELFNTLSVHDMIQAFKKGIALLVKESQKDMLMSDEEAFDIFWKIRNNRPFFMGSHVGPYAVLGTEEHVAIMDVRFDNEADYVRSKGKLMHISRILVGMPKVTGHLSEKGIDFQLGDSLIDNNQDAEHLKSQFAAVIEANHNIKPLHN